jgi:hypothetical protein
MGQSAVNHYKSGLAAFLLAMVAAVPSVAQWGAFNPDAPRNEVCTACFAYLEFPPPPDTDPAASESTGLATAPDGQAARDCSPTSAAIKARVECDN